MGVPFWWIESTACYYEPKVHDYELFWSLYNVNLYILMPLAVFGLIFNSSALICLYTPPKITSGVFLYLKVLLILDHCHIFVTSATVLLPQLCDSHHSRNHTFYKLCMFERRFFKYTMPRLETTINTMHVWTIASLSAHRYWKISQPVVSRFKDTAKRARYVLIVMLSLAMLFRLPTFLVELQLKWRPMLRINRRPQTTELMSPYRVIYHSFLDPIFSNFFPFIWMCVFSILTLCEIIKNRHYAYAQFSIYSRNSQGENSFKNMCASKPLTYFQRRADNVRQKQEFRATISITLIIILHLLFHSLQLYNVVRKWQLLLQKECPTRTDYIQSHASIVLSMLSASVNAFVFIAFTNRLKLYVQKLIRQTSRTLFNSNEPPLTPRTTISTDPVMVLSYNENAFL